MTHWFKHAIHIRIWQMIQLRHLQDMMSKIDWSANTTCSERLRSPPAPLPFFVVSMNMCTATHCNTLQYTATHCNTLQHTATHCNTLQHFPSSSWIFKCTLQHTDLISFAFVIENSSLAPLLEGLLSQIYADLSSRFSAEIDPGTCE